MHSIQAIQMIGTQRSGSNLLRVLLNQYPEIVAPHPPHILQRFFPLLPYYGELEDPANMEVLIDDICTLVEINPVPWQGIRLDRQRIFARCRFPKLTEVFRLIYEEMAIANNASGWLCKSLANVHFASQLESVGIEPVYLYLVRDGRDVACSFKKAVVGEKHVYHIAQKWKKDQEACLQLQTQTSSGRFYKLTYENLLRTSEKEMRQVSQFLNVEFSTEIFDYYHSEESQNTSSAGQMWANVSKPIFGNSHKFLSELSKEEILIFEAVAGDTLIKLGYNLMFPDKYKFRQFTKGELSAFDEENNFLKDKAALLIDPEGMKRREAQTGLLKSIRQRVKILE